MTNIRQQLTSLLFFLTSPKYDGANIKQPTNPVKKSINSRKTSENPNNIVYKDDYAIITEATITEKTLEEIIKKLNDNPNITTIIFCRCEIKTPLKRIEYNYILDHSNFTNEADKLSSKFVAVQPLDSENKTLVILFQNLILDENSKSNYHILKTEFKLDKVAKVVCRLVIFEDNESITDMFQELESLYKLSKFTDLEIKNCTFSNPNLFRTKLQTFLTSTGVNLLQERSVVIPSTGSTGTGGAAANSNMQRSDDRNSDSGLPYSRKELEIILKNISGIIDQQFIDMILESYDFIKNNSNSSDHQAKAKVFYYISRINLIAKYPKNLSPNNFRNFRSIDYVRQIIRRLFQKEFPAGLADFLQKLEDSVIFLIQAKDTSKLENLLLVGPAGIGKTSLARIISMIFALSVSSSVDISDEILDKALVNDDALELLYEKLFTLSNYHIIDVKGSSISDINIITGTSNTYTGAKPGVIGEMLVNKRFPVLVFIDELDKMGNYHGGGNQKSLDALYAALLNYLDKQGALDNWLGFSLRMNGVWFVMTANTTNGINNTLLNRVNVVNLESPTAEEKKKIIFQYFLNVLKTHKLIASNKNYTVEKDPSTGEVIKYIIGDKDGKVKIVISDKVFASIVLATQETDGLRAPIRYIDTLWTKLYPQILDGEKQKKAVEFYLDMHNINNYIDLENIDSEVVRGKNIAYCIYESLDGNHKFGYISVMAVKNRSGEVISIIGDDQNHGVLFHSLGKLVNGLLSNLNALVDSSYYAKFGLGIIKMETLNLILTMPNDAVKSAYTADLVATIVVIMISVIRKIPLKNNVIIAGQLVSTGQFVKGSSGGDDKKGKIKYKNIIAAITNNTSLCNLLILPASTKVDKTIQGYLQKLPKQVKVVYAANLGELLEQALDANQIS